MSEDDPTWPGTVAHGPRPYVAQRAGDPDRTWRVQLPEMLVPRFLLERLADLIDEIGLGVMADELRSAEQTRR